MKEIVIYYDKETCFIDGDSNMNIEKINKVLNIMDIAESNLNYYKKKIYNDKLKAKEILKYRERKKLTLSIYKGFEKRKLNIS